MVWTLATTIYLSIWRSSLDSYPIFDFICFYQETLLISDVTKSLVWGIGIGLYGIQVKSSVPIGVFHFLSKLCDQGPSYFFYCGNCSCLNYCFFQRAQKRLTKVLRILYNLMLRLLVQLTNKMKWSWCAEKKTCGAKPKAQI